MVVNKNWIGSTEPATKGDLAELHENIHLELQQFATKEDLRALEKRLEKRMDEKFATKEDLNALETRMQDKLDLLLDLVRGIDQRLNDFERRIVKLELQR